MGIPESFKVGWYLPQKKLGRVTLIHSVSYNPNDETSEWFSVLQFKEHQMQNAEWLWSLVIRVRKLSESGFI